MITEIAQIEIKPGTEKEFEAAVAKAEPLFLRAKGGLGIELHRSIEKPQRYRLIARWATLENHTVDFRGSEERTAALCGMSDVTVHSLPVEPTVVAALRTIAASGTPLSTDHAVEVMRDSYRGYVQDNTQRFRSLFAHLLEDSAPLVIHCTAGKDRTGFACALILHALGVPDDVISEDYLLTNRFYQRDPSASSDLPDHVRQAIGTVQTSFLAAAFEAIDADYGDLETYLDKGIGLGAAERSELETRYLES